MNLKVLLVVIVTCACARASTCPVDDAIGAKCQMMIDQSVQSLIETFEHRVGEWIQVDFGTVKEVAGVITQGRPTSTDQWVRQYKVAYGTTEDSLAMIQVGGSDKIYTGNSDMETKVYNRFPTVLSCRYIPIYPQSWHHHMSMRLEFVLGHCFDKNPL